MRALLLALLFLVSSAPGGRAGTLVAIGGELDPRNRAVYGKIIELAGPHPRICVLGTASSEPARNAAFLVADFQTYGASATYLDVTEDNHDESTADPKILAEVALCSGFYFLGGDQRRIVGAIAGSPLEAALRARLAAGAVIAGTSGGAAALVERMISGGLSLDSLLGRGEAARLESGLGFARGFLIDQHFLKLGRLGRLLAALEKSGLLLGVGVDEDTALVIPAEGPWQVVGTSTVAFLEMPPERGRQGLRLSLLSHGDTFDPQSRAIRTAAGRENTADAGFYYPAGLIASSDIFGKDSLLDLATHLCDSPETEAYGFAFAARPERDFTAQGIRLVLRKTEDSAGFWGRRAGGSPYSVVRLSLSVEPIEIAITRR